MDLDIELILRLKIIGKAKYVKYVILNHVIQIKKQYLGLKKS